MLLNGEKSVELRICFARNPPQPPPLSLAGKDVPVVTTTKYLGFHLDSDLSGDTHIEEVVRKASKRLHFLTVLARHGVPCEDLGAYYRTFPNFRSYLNCIVTMVIRVRNGFWTKAITEEQFLSRISYLNL